MNSYSDLWKSVDFMFRLFVILMSFAWVSVPDAPASPEHLSITVCTTLLKQFRPFEPSMPDSLSTDSTWDVHSATQDAIESWLLGWEKRDTAHRVHGLSFSLGQLAFEIDALKPWGFTDLSRGRIKKITDEFDDGQSTTQDSIQNILIKLEEPLSDQDRTSSRAAQKQTDEVADEELPNSVTQRDSIIRRVDQTLTRIFGVQSYPKKLFDDVLSIVAPTGTSKNALSVANDGIVRYWATQIDQDPLLFSDAVRFYATLRKLDSSSHFAQKKKIGQKGGLEAINGEYFLNPKSKVNAWSLALDLTEGNPMRALRVLSIFGHDDIAQSFHRIKNGLRHPFWLSTLNVFVPMDSSVLYQNGAIDGLMISADLKQKFVKLLERRQKLIRQFPAVRFLTGNDPLSIAAFRSGNYHFIGGAMMVNELVAKGHRKVAGIRLPIVIGELLGDTYKRLIFVQEYLSKDSQHLYRLGYPKKDVPKPEGWTKKQYEIAKYSIELNLLHLELTREQHLAGAEWAWRKLLEYNP